MTIPTSPSLEAARAEIATRIAAAKAAWTAYTLTVESENKNLVDLGSSAAQVAFLSWEMKFRGGGQKSLGPNPVALQMGQIFVAAKVKEGAGTADVYRLLDHVIPYLELKAGTVIDTLAAEVFDDVTRQGFFAVPVIIPFWIHRIIPTT